jgi:hypothetical protein
VSPLAVILALYLAFFVYLLFAGARMSRALGVLSGSASYSGITGIAIGLIGALVSMKFAIPTFLFSMMFASFIFLPTFALLRAREQVLRRRHTAADLSG